MPLAFAFYLRKATLALRCVRIRARALTFESKFTQAVRLIRSLAGVFPRAPILVVTDSWFGNNGLLKPLRRALGSRAHLLARLRVNAVLHDLPVAAPGRAGRPRKYGERLGSVKAMQTALRATAGTYSLNLYGRVRDVVAAEQMVMLKTLRCRVRVVWVYRRTQWIALVTTDLTLTVAQIIEIYGARWKIEIDQTWCLHKSLRQGRRRDRRSRRGDAAPSGGGRCAGHAGARSRRRRPESTIGGDRPARRGGPAARLYAAS
nr:transposase [Thiocapsa bogorovii]